MSVSTNCGGLWENSNLWRRLPNGMLSWNLLIMLTVNVGSQKHFQDTLLAKVGDFLKCTESSYVYKALHETIYSHKKKVCLEQTLGQTV